MKREDEGEGACRTEVGEKVDAAATPSPGSRLILSAK